MKNIINIICVATVWAAVAVNANALTLKSGEVLTSDGTVAKASETATGKNRLAQDGVFISGGIVFIDVNGQTIEVPVNELRGKSREAAREILGEAITQQLQDLNDAAVAHAEELVANGEVDNAVSAVGKSVDEIFDEIDIEATTGAIVGVTQSQHEAILDKFEQEDGERPQHCSVAGVCPN